MLILDYAVERRYMFSLLSGPVVWAPPPLLLLTPTVSVSLNYCDSEGEDVKMKWQWQWQRQWCTSSPLSESA